MSEVLEDNALVRYDNRQVVAVVKGVDKSFLAIGVSLTVFWLMVILFYRMMWLIMLFQV